MILEYMNMKNGTAAEDYHDEDSFNVRLLAPYEALFFSSEQISAGANEAFRMLEDCKTRTRNVEKEMIRAREVMQRLTEVWMYKHLGEEAKEEAEEKIAEEKKERATKMDLSDEYGGLKVSGPIRPTMLLQENATVNATVGPASSLLETEAPLQELG